MIWRGSVVAKLYDELVHTEHQVAQIRKERNQITKKFSGAKAQQDKSQLTLALGFSHSHGFSGCWRPQAHTHAGLLCLFGLLLCCPSRSALTAQSTTLKTSLSTMEQKLADLTVQLETEANKLPNLTSSHTPLGAPEKFKVLQHAGPQIPKAPCSVPATAWDHLRLCEKWHWLDSDSASMISGSRFHFFQYELALLELALIQFTMAKLVKKGLHQGVRRPGQEPISRRLRLSAARHRHRREPSTPSPTTT